MPEVVDLPAKTMRQVVETIVTAFYDGLAVDEGLAPQETEERLFAYVSGDAFQDNILMLDFF